uniref:Helitron_like_N domain-containing protein n=1 Tax=Caenorhabditis tropicalis TaxID=1561998 RepID=A0A1I7UGV3_9PELO
MSFNTIDYYYSEEIEAEVAGNQETESNWLDTFAAPCTVEDIQEAANRQGPRVYNQKRFAPISGFRYLRNKPQKKAGSRRSQKKKVLAKKSSRGPKKFIERPGPCIEKWDTVDVRGVERPIANWHGPFNFLTLCFLTIINSPREWITSMEVVAFARHHFPFFRYMQCFRGRICEALRMSNDFVADDRREYQCQLRYSLRPGVKHTLSDSETLFAKNDPRGEEYFSRLIFGSVGLPRQLFYHLIAHQNPLLAGPENSALFYHLLAIKQLPEKRSRLFKEHLNPSGAEPQFVEEYLVFSVNLLKDPQNLTSYGNAVGHTVRDTVAQRMVDSGPFFEKILDYFKLQNEMKEAGSATWQTPMAEDVENLIFS